ncbi:MAG: hypothetical protein WED04_10805 [Promethearchaeati archaeon SRVP18_Atabeyarchaeia-1]
MPGEEEEDERENKKNRFAKLSELDRTGDKAKYLETDSEEVIIGGAGSTGAAGDIPREAHDLPGIGKQRQRTPRETEKPSEHSDKPALYASVALAAVSLALAAYSILTFYAIGPFSSPLYPISSNGLLFLFAVAVILAALFIYIAISKVREMRLHRYLEGRKQRKRA